MTLKPYKIRGVLRLKIQPSRGLCRNLTLRRRGKLSFSMKDNCSPKVNKPKAVIWEGIHCCRWSQAFTTICFYSMFTCRFLNVLRDVNPVVNGFSAHAELSIPTSVKYFSSDLTGSPKVIITSIPRAIRLQSTKNLLLIF